MNKDENELYKSTEVTNNNDSNEKENQNANENLGPIDETGIYSEEVDNNMNLRNNMIIEEESDLKKNIIVIRKNSMIKKALKNFGKKSRQKYKK